MGIKEYFQTLQNNAKEKKILSMDPINAIVQKSKSEIDTFWVSALEKRKLFQNNFATYCHLERTTSSECKKYCYDFCSALEAALEQEKESENKKRKKDIALTQFEILNSYQNAQLHIKKMNQFSDNGFPMLTNLFNQIWHDYLCNRSIQFNYTISKLIGVIKQNGPILQAEYIKQVSESELAVLMGAEPDVYRIILKEAASIGIVKRIKKGSSYELSLGDETLLQSLRPYSKFDFTRYYR